MKIHLAWMRVTAAAATIATFGGQFAAGQGQYGPYPQVPQYSAPQYAVPQNAAPQYAAPQYSTVAPYGFQPTQPAPVAQATQQPVYPTTSAPTYRTASRTAYTPTPQSAFAPAQQPQQRPAYTQAPQQQSYIPATQQRYAPTVQAPPSQQYSTPQNSVPQYSARPQYQPPQYQAPVARPAYPAIARQSTGTVTPGTALAGVAMPSAGSEPQPTETLPPPTPSAANDAAAQGYNDTASPYPSTDGYMASDPGYGGCNSGACGAQDCGTEACLEDCDGGCRWFGGIYGLYMTRDNPGFQRLAVSIDDNAASYPYYPPARTTVLSTDSNDFDYQPGFEVRFGAIFSTGGDCGECGDYGGCNGGGCNGGCGSYCPPQDYAWEAAYWMIDGDTQWSVFNDYIPTDNFRTYGMKNFVGLQYDRDGAGGAYGWRPVNVYYDYQLPITQPTPPAAGDIRVVTQRVRTNFSAQNLELNILRLPMFCSGGCGGYGGCDTGCDGSCAGYGSCDCAPTCESPFSLIGLCGVRYLRVDDNFEFGNWYSEYDGATWLNPDALYYDINVDNHLVGFQLGANMNYCVACRWNLFWDTNFGLYNNYINSYQRVYGAGDVQYAGSGENAAVRSHKDDVAFLGEMRIGGACDISCNWRAVLAYRAIGISGVALSTDQIATNFTNPDQVGFIDSNGAMIIHGVQAGLECRY